MQSQIVLMNTDTPVKTFVGLSKSVTKTILGTSRSVIKTWVGLRN